MIWRRTVAAVLTAVIAVPVPVMAVQVPAPVAVASTVSTQYQLLPTPTGPYAIGTTEVHLVDRARKLEMMVRVWYPTRSTQRQYAAYARHARLRAKPWGRHPVLLYSPGSGTHEVEELASRGFVVVTTNTRVADVRFVLDALPRRLRHAMDLDRISAWERPILASRWPSPDMRRTVFSATF